MPDAAPSPQKRKSDVPWWRRPLSLAIAVLINLLLLLLLLEMTPSLPGSKNGQGSLTTFNVSDDDKNANSQKKQQQQKRAAKATATTKTPQPKATVVPPVVVPSKLPSDFIPLSKEEFASSEISKLPTHADEAGTSASANGGQGQGDSALAGGSGPHGEPLYAAEWYRRPTDAELDPFLPKNGIPEGAWGEIACQTMPRFHVDNCVALEDSPAGSHLARAVQAAGWQFLVRPPRVGGKTLVGAWVRIRITFTESARRH